MPGEKSLQISSVIGFGGQVQGGFHCHPDGVHVIYPLGSTIVIRNLQNQQNNIFLQGHNGPITCIAVSKSGRFLASGQSTYMGFQADVIVWDFEKKELLHRMTLHKVKVQALSFSGDEKFLATVGGQDDNTLVVWDIKTAKPICGSSAANSMTNCLAYFNNCNNMLVTGGEYVLRVWEIDFQNRKMNPTDCNLGQLRRIFSTMMIDAKDDQVYCGTTSGDVMCVQLNGPKNLKYGGPAKKLSQGVLCIAPAPDAGNILIGSGDGTVQCLKRANLEPVSTATVMGAVTSVSHNKANNIFIGTAQSIIYRISPNSSFSKPELISTCHSQRINDVCYPALTSSIFATCSANDIRIWNAQTSAELLRIQVPNLECNCICFDRTGSSIISGWSDGKIRAFGPETGKILYVINDAHKVFGQKRVSGALLGVTAIATTNDGTRLVSGGSDGQVRVWRISQANQPLIGSMKEHKATINTIHVRRDDSECVTASDDGSCIVWNLEKFVRANIMYAQTYFKAAVYLNDESQILTAGTDKKITYWDTGNCSPIRELEMVKDKAFNTIDISPDGLKFASGGDDKTIKLWHYDDGEVISVGRGHAGSVKKLRFSPDQKFITSVGDEGAIFTWRTV